MLCGWGHGAAISVTAVALWSGGGAHGHYSAGVATGLFPINPALGVSGFPDCIRVHPEISLSMEAASFDLDCTPKVAAAGSQPIRVAVVGDSITAGVHSSGGNHTYPFQLQMLLDKTYGFGAYIVSNLGACGSTMLRHGDSPYWKRPQFAALTAARWDIVTIMLGTNDAKDRGDGGPADWNGTCIGHDGNPTLTSCPYADSYAAMVEVIRGVGPRQGLPPRIYAAIPPPLMAPRAYGMNQTVINHVLPTLVPMIAERAKLDGVIDIFKAMGGLPPPSVTACTLGTAGTYAPCGWWCDAQSCDQCHPNDVGYAHMAGAFLAGLRAGLPPPPPPPPPGPGPVSPDGAWVYEFQGAGKLFVPAANFTAPNRSGLVGPRGWDACEFDGALRFDNGRPLRSGTAGAQRTVGAVAASGSLVLRGWTGCGRTFSYKFNASGAFSAQDGIRYVEFIYLEISSGLPSPR